MYYLHTSRGLLRSNDGRNWTLWDAATVIRHEEEPERWIDQLNEFYSKIVNDPNIPPENLDKANEAICRCIEELRPLATGVQSTSQPDKIYLTEMSLMELLEGKIVYTDGTEEGPILIPPKTDELGIMRLAK